MPRGVYPRKKRKAPHAGRRSGTVRRRTMHPAAATLESPSRGTAGRRRLKRQPHDFHFEVTEFGLRVQVGSYLVQISELIGNDTYDSEDED